MKKIDAHLHLAEVLAGYCRRGELRAIGGGKAAWGNGEEFQLIPPELGDTNFTAEQALKVMDENDVERAVLMHGSMYGFQNRYHAELIKKYPDRFCPSCTIDPFMTNYMDTMEFFFEEQGFHLAKFEVSTGGGLMGCHDPFDLAGERMMNIYKLVEKHNGVVALDVGDISMPSHQPWSIMEAAKACPDLKFVVCHLLAPTRGWEREWKLSLELLNLPNVWFDIAALPKIMSPDVYPYKETCSYLADAKKILGAKKLLWGTDAPFAATQDSYTHLADYLEHNDIFTDSELEDVYYNNSKEVYF
ncbi:MAG: amidohydrolase family protein [Eubacteriales bacterium]|nr:amidohydrolase family protein [Eubacteriales bacterium]